MDRPYEILLEVMGAVDFPILAEYDSSHTHPMITLPIGIQAHLDATNQSLTVVFKNGEQQNRIKNDYGRCILKVFYKNKLISEIGHFKKNNWFTNNYYFVINRIADEIEVKCKIEGPSSDFFENKFVSDENGNP